MEDMIGSSEMLIYQPMETEQLLKEQNPRLIKYPHLSPLSSRFED